MPSNGSGTEDCAIAGGASVLDTATAEADASAGEAIDAEEVDASVGPGKSAFLGDFFAVDLGRFAFVALVAFVAFCLRLSSSC